MKDLEKAIETMLRTIPERWAEFDPDGLTHTEQTALFHLTAAEMVERRLRFRVRMFKDTNGYEAAIEATGEGGLVDAMSGLVREMYDKWQPAYYEWKTAAPEESPFVVEQLKPSHWRLTDQGVLALSDLDSERQRVLDFVLWRGIFDGKPRLIKGKVSQRHPIGGRGKLLNFRKTDSNDTPQPITVNIGNFGSRGETLAQVLKTAFNQQRPSSEKDGKPQEEPPAVLADEHDTTCNIPVDDQELTILIELAEMADKTLSRVEITACTNLKDGTVKDKLAKLEKRGLVGRPLGERSGYSITDLGRKVAKRNQ